MSRPGPSPCGSQGRIRAVRRWYAPRLVTADLFCGVEGFEGFAGGVVVGVGAEVCADAVAVELVAYRVENGASDEADVVLVNVVNHLGQDRGCGVVDVCDGRAVEHYPLQRV